jgi:hypothetical protein
MLNALDSLYLVESYPENMSTNSSSSKSHIDVRYSKFYTIIVIALSLIFLALGVEDMISEGKKRKVGFMKYACDKNDLQVLLSSLTS